MDHQQNQKPNDRVQEISFDPPDDQTGSSGGKLPTSASAREVSFDPPDDETGGSGGKLPGSASGRES
jgi:hypothetical protein